MNDTIFSDVDDNFYLTLNVDMENETVEIFDSAESVGKNICNKDYLDRKTICNEKIPFTIGMMVSGSPVEPNYSHFKLYGCRLYDRVLSGEEIKLNYNESKNLLND